MKTFAFTTAAVLSALPLLASAATPTPAQQKAAAVRGALTNVDKINALDDSDFAFDFTDPKIKATSGAGGKLVSANLGNFAALALGDTLALTVGFMEPCGMNSPHTHPRANEILLVLPSGSSGEPTSNVTRRAYDQGPISLTSAFIQENGSRVVVNNLTAFSAMLFPKGSIHFQANFGCESIQFVAALSDPDPGTLQVAQRYFALSPEAVGASLGGLGVQEVEHLASMIPDNMIAGQKECYDRCGIPYPTDQPKKQQQPTSTATQPAATETATQPAVTETGTGTAAPAPSASGQVIVVNVGENLGLTYSNDNIEAVVGDIVEFHFVSKNHTVTRSAFDKPCDPLVGDGAFDSGFMPVDAAALEVKTFRVPVTDDKPIWFYCAQRPAGAPKGHCALGMNGAINAPKEGPKTLAEFKKLAEKST